MSKSKILWIAAALALLMVLMVVIGVYLAGGTRRQIDAELQRIRDEGYPTTLEELNDWCAMPPGENAADRYYRAFAAMVEDSEFQERVKEIGEPELGEVYSDDAVEIIRAYLAKNEEALALSLAAPISSEACYDVDLRQVAVDRPHLTQLRRLVRLLDTASEMAAVERDADRQLLCIHAVIAAGASLEKETGLVAQLVHVSILAMANRMTERSLAATALTEEQLIQLATYIPRAVPERSLVHALVGERVLGFEAWDEQFAGRQGLPIIGGIIRRDQLNYLQLLRECVEAAENFENLPSNWEPVTEIGTLSIITNITAPTMKPLFVAPKEVEMRSRSAHTALAAKRYELAHGRLPDSLDQLVPRYLDAVPLDWFDGQPLKYKRTEAGALIYSVGRDGKDDGGVRQEQSQNGWDMVFELRNRPER